MEATAQIQAMADERARLITESRTVLDGAATENRSMSAEETASYDAMVADVDSLDERIVQRLDAEERAAKADEHRARFDKLGIRPSVTPGDESEVETEVDKTDAFFRGQLPDRSMEFSSKLVSDAEYRAVQVVGTPSAGGNLVPTDFWAQLVRIQVANSNILAMGPKFIDTTGGNPLAVPTVGPTYGAAVAVAENASAAAASDTFGQATLGAFKFEVFVQLSHELIEDSGIDVIGFVADDAGRKLVNKYGAKLVTGAGTTEPQGLFTAASAAVTGSGATTVSADNLIDLQHAVLPQYRRNGAWVMNDSTLAAVRKLKDSNGRYLLDISTVPNQPDTILGHPVFQDPNVSALLTGQKTIAFGDPQGYIVRRVNGVRFERSDDFAFDKDLVTFRAIVRLDAQLIDTASWKVLVQP